MLVLTALFSSVDTEHSGSFRKHRCSERLFSLLPFVERAGFRTGSSDWPVVVEEEQDADGEERAAGGAGGIHPGGGELLAMPWLGGLVLRPRALPVPGRPPGGRRLPSCCCCCSDSVDSTGWGSNSLHLPTRPARSPQAWVCTGPTPVPVPRESRSSPRLGKTLSSRQERTRANTAVSRGSWGTWAQAGQRGALSGGGQPVLQGRAGMAHSSFQYNFVFVKQNEKNRLYCHFKNPVISMIQILAEGHRWQGRGSECFGLILRG